MAGSRRIIEYKDFTGGEWGEREPWLAEKNQFTGTNVLVYRTGEIGPRPGIRNFTPVGTTTFACHIFDINGRLAIIRDNGAAARIESCLYGLGGNLFTHTGTFGADNPGSIDIFQHGNTWYIQGGTSVYKFSGSGPTLTTLATGVQANFITLHGERLVVGNLGTSGSSPGSIRYSDPPVTGEFTSWPAGNLIIVGDSRSSVNELYEQRGNLIIVKGEGTFSLSGVPGVNETLRRIFHSIGFGGQDNRETIWGLNYSGKFPSAFNGASEVRWDNVGLFTANGSLSSGFDSVGTVNYFDGTEEGGVCFLMEGSQNPLADTRPRALIRHRGVWTKHVFNNIQITTTLNGTPGSKFHTASVGEMPKDPGITAIGDPDYPFYENIRQRGFIVMATNSGSSSNNLTLYEFPVGLDRPGCEIPTSTDLDLYNYERAGDDSSQQVAGEFSLREEHFVDGTEVRVRGLVVDFRKWNTGGSLTNHFDVSVDTLRPWEGTAPVSSGTLSFDEAGSSASTAGTLQRKYFSIGDSVQGGGFQVHFENIRGVAIQRVQVIVDTYEPRF